MRGNVNVFQGYYLVIESTASRLQNEAMAAQKALFANPGSLSHKRAYGYALLAWAKETRNAKAKAFAKGLLEHE